MRQTMVAAVAALSAIVVAGCSSVPHPANSAAAASTPTSVTAAPSGTTGSTGAALLNEVRAWYDRVNPAFAAIQQDTKAIASAAGRRNVAEVQLGCGHLKVDAAAAAAQPPAPQQQLARVVAAGIADYQRGAASCLNGDLPSTTQALNQGAAYLNQAASIMANLS
ncbi:MAG: hypothetical protein ACR2LF_02480 [Jatrophihabitantaceae bacterium]